MPPQRRTLTRSDRRKNMEGDVRTEGHVSAPLFNLLFPAEARTETGRLIIRHAISSSLHLFIAARQPRPATNASVSMRAPSHHSTDAVIFWFFLLLLLLYGTTWRKCKLLICKNIAWDWERDKWRTNALSHVHVCMSVGLSGLPSRCSQIPLMLRAPATLHLCAAKL